MKNTKAVFYIILGSFIMATGFAFAVESETYNDLVKNGVWGTRSGTSDLGAAAGTSAPTPPAAAPSAAPAATPQPPAPGAPAAAPAPKPEEKPTFGENVKKFLGKHMATMVMTGVGAYVGMALLGGPIGLVVGGLFMFALMFLGSL